MSIWVYIPSKSQGFQQPVKRWEKFRILPDETFLFGLKILTSRVSYFSVMLNLHKYFLIICYETPLWYLGIILVSPGFRKRSSSACEIRPCTWCATVAIKSEIYSWKCSKSTGKYANSGARNFFLIIDFLSNNC